MSRPSLMRRTKQFLLSTSDYNRDRVFNLLKETNILKKIKEKGGDWQKHLQFYVGIMQGHKRLALQILEGLFEAIDARMVSMDLKKEEQNQIQDFIRMTNGFSHILYQFFKDKGKDALLEILAFSEEILDDKAGPDELLAFAQKVSAQGYDGEAILFAVSQKAIPPSGASFVKKQEAQGLWQVYIKSGDFRRHVPEALRALGRFGGGKIQKVTWQLKDGEMFDPQGKVVSLLAQLRYPDSGKGEDQIKEDTQADRKQFIQTLQAFVDDIENEEKKNKALEDFLAYARHHDQLREKVDQFQGSDYVSIDLLDQLFRDKDNLSVLIREVLEKKDIHLSIAGKQWEQNVQKLKEALLNHSSLDLSLPADKKNSAKN